MKFFYACSSQLKFIGLDKAVATLATLIRDISAIAEIDEQSFIYYFLNEGDNITHISNVLRNNKLIQYVLIYDENYYLININKINQREHIQLLAQASYIIATSYRGKGIIEQVSNKFVYEIPTAIASYLLPKYQPAPSEELLVVADTKLPEHELTLLCNKFNLTPCVIYISEKMTEREEENLVNHLSRHRFVISCTTTNDPWTLYAAAQGCIVIGAATNDYLRYCYAYTITQEENLTHYFEILVSLQKDVNRNAFLTNLAEKKSVSFNPTNLSYTICSYHRDATTASSPPSAHILTGLYLSFAEEITVLSGKTHIELAKNEFVVFCAVKNGAHYVKEWMEHYIRIGASHFFIVDNGSTDDTILSFNHYPNVTILQTRLDFKYYESEIRKFVVKNYCQKMWCLSVDIDEFFDFPMSDCITMSNFLEYQNNKGYTAVISHMLDMFCDKGLPGKSFREQHQFYDNNKLFKNFYYNLGKIYNRYNKLSDKNLKFFYGGIRSIFFDGAPSEILLLKHSLTYQDGTLEPHTDPHYCDKAYLSDISCVLFHYKFTDFSIATIKERAKNKIYNYFADVAYQAYLTSFEKEPDISLYSEHAKKYTGISSLLDEQFITISPAYTKMVRVLNHQAKGP
jgi:hypothetical protein